MQCWFLEKTLKFKSLSPIDADSQEYMFFLQWLVENKDFTAMEIIDVAYYPHKYKALQTEYLIAKEKGGTYAY